MSQLQWYPGHMEKARRQMEEKLKDVDLVIELRDARLPLSSANPLLEKMISGKLRLIVLTKKDRSDSRKTAAWLSYFGEENMIAVDTLHDDVKQKVLPAVRKLLEPKRQKALKRGIRNKILRIMVAGIPNVGKSTFINRLSGRSSLKAENRPGVTRTLSTIKLEDGLELVDTPGVLWPKFSDPECALKLALVGSLNDQILDRIELAEKGISFLQKEYPGLLQEIYGLEDEEGDLLEKIGYARSLLKSGGEADRLRTADTFLNELRNDKRYQVTYDTCPAGE